MYNKILTLSLSLCVGLHSPSHSSRLLHIDLHGSHGAVLFSPEKSKKLSKVFSFLMLFLISSLTPIHVRY